MGRPEPCRRRRGRTAHRVDECSLRAPILIARGAAGFPLPLGGRPYSAKFGTPHGRARTGAEEAFLTRRVVSERISVANRSPMPSSSTRRDSRFQPRRAQPLRTMTAGLAGRTELPPPVGPCPSKNGIRLPPGLMWQQRSHPDSTTGTVGHLGADRDPIDTQRRSASPTRELQSHAVGSNDSRSRRPSAPEARGPTGVPTG